ncbi:MAG: DUF3102 domain-containing protein [Pleurocapsa sp. MO_192.B19]|nr:DUF3102 domain-containing protein [Pleurocapsa sp. MO_192.B19]
MFSNVPVKILSHKSFEYSSLDAETLNFVKQQTGEIRLLMKRTTQDIIEIGQRLIEVKKCLGHGRYRRWIEAEFDWGKSTANSFENVAKQFADVQNLDVFAPSALYELAAPSTPQAAREEAIALAKAGKRISYTVSKQIKRKHQTKPNKQKAKSKKQPFPSKASPLVLVEREESSKNSLLRTSTSVDYIAPLPQLNQGKIVDINSASSQQSSRSTSKTTAKKLFSAKSKLSQSERWWRLGNHYLYHGEPNSPQFQNHLPEKIALAVAFPPNLNWHWGNLESRINSSLTLFSSYKDIDLKLLRELLRNALELYTEGEETVFWAFVPDPALLLLAESMDCQCFLAESDIERCQAVIHAWKQIGGKVNTGFLYKTQKKAL